jgi:TAT (twin-arginine translocation) pathway signal sequence
MSRRQFLAAGGASGALLLLPGLPEAASAACRVGSTGPGDSIVISWSEAFLAGVRGSTLGPPMVARALAIGHTCIYDAWAACDRKAELQALPAAGNLAVSHDHEGFTTL